jgi:hypothetical protein
MVPALLAHLLGLWDNNNPNLNMLKISHVISSCGANYPRVGGAEEGPKAVADQKGACAQLRSLLSAPATRFFSTEWADCGLSLRPQTKLAT